MKRIFYLFKHDLISNFRDFMLAYMVIAPILITLLLKLFVPSVGSEAFRFALKSDLDQSLIDEYNKVGLVELYDTVDEIKDRVNDIDDVGGLYKDENNEYKIIVEGNEVSKVIENKTTNEKIEKNETESIILTILMNYYEGENSSVLIERSDIGYELSPIVSIGALSVIIMVYVLSGMLLGLTVINDKEQMTIQALWITPMSKSEYVIGKSLLSLFITFVETYIILWMMGLMSINLLQIFVMSVTSFGVTLVLGFFLGVTSKNQMEGIATAKMFFFLVSASVIGGLLLPDNLQILLYCSPIYWSFIGLYNIILGTITWTQVLLYSSYIVALTIIVFVLLKNKIQKGLTV